MRPRDTNYLSRVDFFNSINSNRVEWSTIDEENEHAPLIAADPGKRPHFYSSSASHKEISEKVAITEAVHAGELSSHYILRHNSMITSGIVLIIDPVR